MAAFIVEVYPCVENPTNGIYIINGRKVVIK